MLTPFVNEIVASAKRRIVSLSVADVVTEICHINSLLVDVREPDEQKTTGMLPDAISASRGMLEFYADPTSPYHHPAFSPTRRMIVYCTTGNQSALAVNTLQQMGYTNVVHLAGGIRAWVAAGQPVQMVAEKI